MAESILPLASSQDHKRLADGWRQWVPTPAGWALIPRLRWSTKSLHQQIHGRTIIRPDRSTGMRSDGPSVLPAFLYAGVIADP